MQTEKAVGGLDLMVGLAVVSSPMEVGADEAGRILQEAIGRLKDSGITLLGAYHVDSPASARQAGSAFKDVDVVCAIAATWFEDYLVQDILSAMEAASAVVAWGVPGLHTGSLCGMLQLCCVLKEIGVDYRFIYGQIDDAETILQLIAYSKACAVRRQLRRTRFARIGARTSGMTEVALDELELRSLFGPRLIEYGLDRLEEQVQKADLHAAEDLWRAAKATAGTVAVTDSEGVSSMKYYLALRDFCAQEEVSAFAVECYPKLMGKVCLPISMLAQQDIVGACEGDINSALAMRILAWMSGKPIHNTDLLADYPEDNSVVFSHCGSGAFCLASDSRSIQLKPCRLNDLGVTVQYSGRPGKVTLLNIVGRRGTYRIGAAAGTAVQTDLVFPGNPVRVQLGMPVQRFIYDIAKLGLGHHWMICEGDVGDELSAFAELTGAAFHLPGI